MTLGELIRWSPRWDADLRVALPDGSTYDVERVDTDTHSVLELLICEDSLQTTFNDFTAELSHLLDLQPKDSKGEPRSALAKQLLDICNRMDAYTS